MQKLIQVLTGAALLTLLATPALAHEGHAHGGLLSGLAHPFTGLDHLLAMLAVGFVAFSRGKGFLALPAAFMGFMLVGAGLGFYGVAVPAVETGIALSVLVLGLMLAFSNKLPLVASVAVTGLFAVCHGHAHATEMASGSSAALYIAGFVAGTGILHLMGFGLSAIADRALQQRWIAPVAGLGTAGIGAVMLMGLV
jgi:urease accessory protein